MGMARRRSFMTIAGWLGIVILTLGEMLASNNNIYHPVRLFTEPILTVGLFLVTSWFVMVALSVPRPLLWLLKVVVLATIFWYFVRSFGHTITTYWGIRPEELLVWIVGGMIVLFAVLWAFFMTQRGDTRIWGFFILPKWLEDLSPLNLVLIRMGCWSVLGAIWVNFWYWQYRATDYPAIYYAVFSVGVFWVLACVGRVGRWESFYGLLRLVVAVLSGWLLRASFWSLMLPGVRSGVSSMLAFLFFEMLVVLNFMVLPVVLVWLRSHHQVQPSRQI